MAKILTFINNNNNFVIGFNFVNQSRLLKVESMLVYFNVLQAIISIKDVIKIVKRTSMKAKRNNCK